jgi:hypothetical protein
VCRNHEFCTKISPLIFKGFLVAQVRCRTFRHLRPRYCQRLGTDATKRWRLGHPATSIPTANFTPETPSGNGLSHRGAATLSRSEGIDQFNKIQGVAFLFPKAQSSVRPWPRASPPERPVDPRVFVEPLPDRREEQGVP